MRKLISLFDVHIPENINLKPVLDFMKDFKPDIVILGGDFLHLNYFSRWAEMKPNDLAGDKFKQDIIIANKILDKIDKFAAPKAEKYYLEGNHEERIRRFIEKFPYLAQVLDLQRELRLKERNYKWVSYNNYAKVGKLYFIHGHYTSKYHSNKHLQVYGKNIRYGHVHDYQIASQISPIDFQRRLGISIPCLCHLNPDYMKNKPNKWINGFHYAYIDKNGLFYEFIPIITHGKFMANGKLYT